MNLLCTSFAKITPDHSKKVSISTIQKISNYFTFIWLTGDEEGFIIAYEIPNYGKPKKYSVSDIKKLLKNNNQILYNHESNNTLIRIENVFLQKFVSSIQRSIQ